MRGRRYGTYNIFYTFVLLDWGKRCGEKLGDKRDVTFEYTLDGTLRTAEQNTQRGAFTSAINDLEYAVDLVVFETDQTRFSEATKVLDETCSDQGAEISITNTTWMYVSPDQNDELELPEDFIRSEKIERVHEFLHLSSLVGDN